MRILSLALLVGLYLGVPWLTHASESDQGAAWMEFEEMRDLKTKSDTPELSKLDALTYARVMKARAGSAYAEIEAIKDRLFSFYDTTGLYPPYFSKKNVSDPDELIRVQKIREEIDTPLIEQLTLEYIASRLDNVLKNSQAKEPSNRWTPEDPRRISACKKIRQAYMLLTYLRDPSSFWGIEKRDATLFLFYLYHGSFARGGHACANIIGEGEYTEHWALGQTLPHYRQQISINISNGYMIEWQSSPEAKLGESVYSWVSGMGPGEYDVNGVPINVPIKNTQEIIKTWTDRSVPEVDRRKRGKRSH